MINSITSSIGSAMTIRNSSAQHRPPPPENDAFQLSDSDGDGLLASSELTSLVESITETTGTAINAADAMTTYDTNQDGGLSGEELLAMMTDYGFSPPPVKEGGPPPPPPPEQVMASYADNSSQGLISELLQNLETGESGSEETSSINITS